ncbi:MAG: SLBB domain-containing protein [Bacteroidales bacterium]|nr:SLBB domain-containing protein [Bacteroidales bacterium]
MKKILTAILCMTISLVAFAQSANMLSMARAELAKRGLEETEVRARLMQEGIDVDSIPPTEYANYQSRVMDIINKMQAEKAAAKAAAVQTTPSAGEAETVSGTDIIATAAAQAETPNEFPQTTLGEAAAEEALETALEENNVSKTAGDDIYGHALFTGTSMDVFRTTDGAQAPETYILGDGDEVHISIFGSSQTEIHQRIAPDGSIQPAGSSKIFLKGMTLAQGRKAIISKLSQHYSFRQDQIAITITTARTVMVNIYGEVGVQGGFTISALNNAFNALAAAGGPTAMGSIRNIQRSRAGKTERLDLYKFMTGEGGKVQFDVQNNDVLFVPVTQKIVRIEGAVKRPMRYELIDGESLKDLIQYAGGLNDNAYPNFVQIERREAGELKYIEYDLSKIVDGKQKAELASGDVVRIKTADRPMENFVSIGGDVYYGGRFDFEKNNSLQALIAKAEPRFTARRDFVFVERTYDDETVEVLTVPFPGEEGNPDFKLQARDQVRVLQQAQFQDKGTITVTGDVRNPFTREFGLNDHMTLSQAIEYAEGARYTARKDYVFVERTKPDETVEVLTIPFPGENGNPDFELQARDVVRVLAQASYRDTEEISVSGQVRNPFTKAFGLNDRMTVAQAIEYAGGLRPTVYPVAYIFRKDITNPAKRQYFPVSLETEGETLLQPGDELRVYDNTTYTNIGELRVSGAVKTPVNITFDSSVSMHDLLTMAGGFTVGASYDKVQVFRMNISKKDEVSFDTITLTVDENYYPTDKNFQLQPYDHIVVRMTPNFTQGRTVEINGRVKYPGVYVIEDSRTQLSSIIKLAGGLLDDASPYCTLFRTYNGRGVIGIDLNDLKKMHLSKNWDDPILMDGDVVNIVRAENVVVIRELGTRMAQYIPADFSSTQKTLVYHGGRSAKWYIDNYAGGLVKTADKNSVTVTLPNYQTVGTKRFLGIRSYPKVEPGSTITVAIDQEKREQIEKPQEKTKVDWDAVLSRTLATITSVASFILLIERL